MDVHNKWMEMQSKVFRQELDGIDWNELDLCYSVVDTINKHILTLSSDYEWHLLYWDMDLDLQVGERLIPGVNSWTNYSAIHGQILRRSRRLI